MRFEARDGAFYADGKKTVIYSGAMHYFRVLPEYWHDRLSKLKACGFNTVETYMCWNLHEPKKGQFDFSGRLDIRRYIETARKLGLYVILRPGPYICAEWDAGGFPAWLLADENLRLRCNDAVYLSHVRDYIARVMEEVGDLQCTEGGPIIAMQVENEYGSYGNDKTYLAALKGIMEECGAKVLLFTSDGTCPYMLAGGSTPGALVTVNFGSNVAGSFAALKEVQKDAPEMCTEFWCGWFDHFGEKHHTRGYKSVLKEVEAFLDRGASFNFYMFHGGTNFGFTAGANYAKRYQPTVTSYDYCALLNEYGGYTPAYHAVRDLMWSKQGVKPPVLPPEPETQDIGKVSLTECTGLMENEDTVGVKHRSAGGAGLSGRFHDHFRIALVGDHHQKLIFGILQCALLSFFKFPSLDQKLQLPAAADAAEGNNKRDPRSGNIDLDLRLQAALQFPPFGIRHHGKQHGLLRGLQPKGVQDLRSRRSAAQRLEGYGYSMLLIKGQKAPRLVPVADDRHKV